jgi:hypothetical protein
MQRAFLLKSQLFQDVNAYFSTSQKVEIDPYGLWTQDEWEEWKAEKEEDKRIRDEYNEQQWDKKVDYLNSYLGAMWSGGEGSYETCKCFAKCGGQFLIGEIESYIAIEILKKIAKKYATQIATGGTYTTAYSGFKTIVCTVKCVE